jgi:hypothetical protein
VISSTNTIIHQFLNRHQENGVLGCDKVTGVFDLLLEL